MTELATPFLDARASAVVAKEVARDVLRHLEEAGDGDSVTVQSVEPVSGTFPAHPLDTAVRDLALATLASSHAAEAASRAGNADDARAAGEAARLAAQALSLTEAVAASGRRRSNVNERVRVAHAVAATAFAAARLVAPRGGPSRRSHVRTAFPASWRHLIQILGQAIEDDETRPDDVQHKRLLDAASAARDGAEAARHAYDRLQAGGAAGPAAASRFVRVAALAAAYAGCAALVPLRLGDGGALP
jgi:hypothetical protein